MPILYIRDGNGNFVPIPALKGKDGKSAYEQAKEGGFQGSEEEFIALLNGIASAQVNPIGLDDSEHISDFNNPHKVTKEQVGLKDVSLYEAGGGAVGKDASASSGGAIGYRATSGVGGAVGENANATRGGAVGEGASATSGGAVGEDAKTSTGFAGGVGAKTVDANNQGIDAIQLGRGTNPNEKTLQVYDYQLMDANGKIPAERLPSSCNIQSVSYIGTGTDGYDGKLTFTFDFVPKLVFVAPANDIQITDKVCYECEPMIMIHGVGNCTGGSMRKATITTSSTNYTEYVCNAGGIVTWNDKSVSWKADAEWENKELAAIQLYNYLGTEYKIVALG